MTSCNACGTSNREGLRFCTNCGASLALACPSCGALLEPHDRFCGACGSEVSQVSQAGAAETSGTERRVVSILFVDLVGWTSFSEHKDPEEARVALSEYFELCNQVVARYGGVVEKFIGDAVMAMWGAPVAREDDAERAVRAALEIVSAVSGLADGRVTARAGIHTGEASVVLRAQGQGMVAGDSVNTASRLQAIAEPGTVLVDETTRVVTNQAIFYEPAGEVALKGRDQPVVAWRASRVIGSVGGRKADPLEPPFTGREEELRIMKDLLHAVGREGRPRSISVVGIAGIGKSRLVWELYKYVDGLVETVLWHEGRSPAYGDGIAFWALAEMVRMRAGIAESDDPQTAKDKLHACLAEYVRDPDEASWIGSALLHLLGIEVRSEDRGEQLFAAWRTFFERVAERDTTVLVFEDLQWADQGLLDFIDHLVTWAKNSPILLLTLARPELYDRRADWGVGQRNFLSVHLDPLTDDEIATLLKGVVPDLPGSVVDQVVQRSEGVPLYAVEMIRMLLGSEQVVQKDGSLSVIGDIDRVDIPDSLHSLIAARLDALPPEARTTVLDASVLGKSFTLEAVATVSDLDDDRVRSHLDDLVRREVLQLEQDPRSPERGQYAFLQSLIREVAYQVLSRSDRRERHIRAARYFESFDGSEVAEVVATHWLEAYALAGDPEVARDIADKARPTLIEAAERAASLGSTGQALTLYEKAASITPDAELRGELLVRAGNAAADGALPEKAVEHLSAAIDLLADSPSKQNWARASLGTAYFHTGELDAAQELLRSVAEGNADPRQDPTLPTLYGNLGRICLFKGDLDGAKRWCEEALEWAERHDDIRAITDALISQGVIAISRGRVREALVILRGCRDLAERNGLVGEQVRASINISSAESEVHPGLFRETCDATLRLCRRYGLRIGELYIGSNALEVFCHTAEWDVCDAIVERLAPEELEGISRAFLAPYLAQLSAYRGDVEGAIRELEIARIERDKTSSLQDHITFETARLITALVSGDWKTAQPPDVSLLDRWIVSECFSLVARMALWQGDLETCRTIVERYDARGPRGDWAEGRRVTMKAGLAALEGDKDRSAELYRHALQLWDELDIPVDRAFCVMDRVVALGADGPGFRDAASAAGQNFKEWGNGHMAAQIADLLA